MTRPEAINILNSLYGVPGAPGAGQKLLVELIEDLGTDALTDYALCVLAGKHIDYENFQIRNLEGR